MNFYKKLLGILSLSLLFLSTGYIKDSEAYLTSLYGFSCTNVAYGTQNGNIYISVYATQSKTQNGLGTTALATEGEGVGQGSYSGINCVYSGAGRTNSSAIVSGDVARVAANAIVGSVTSRIMTAMSQSEDTAANMSYSANGNGIGMAANGLIGGLSLWTNYTSTDFDNDQTFTAFRFNSNAYTGDASALTVGVDKRIGNFLVGVVSTNFDTDLDTSVNSGTYKADGNTYGVYVGLNTGILNISAGIGTGEYDVDTTRIDLGTGTTTITGSAVADVEYQHVSASATLSRGKFSISPRVAFRSLDLDTPSFTDVVPNDSNTGMVSTAGVATDTIDTDAADETVSAFAASTEMTEVGLSIAANLGIITPYVDYAYVDETTTSATYRTSLTTKDTASSDQAASNSDGYTSFGGGIMINLRNRLTGTISYYDVTDRDDYNEDTTSFTLRLQF
jgi:hypothetical protein